MEKRWRRETICCSHWLVVFDPNWNQNVNNMCDSLPVIPPVFGTVFCDDSVCGEWTLLCLMIWTGHLFVCRFCVASRRTNLLLIDLFQDSSNVFCVGGQLIRSDLRFHGFRPQRCTTPYLFCFQILHIKYMFLLNTWLWLCTLYVLCIEANWVIVLLCCHWMHALSFSFSLSRWEIWDGLK